MGSSNDSNSVPATEVVFYLSLCRTLIAVRHGDNSFSGDFHSIRWKQLQEIAKYLCRVCTSVLGIGFSEINNNEIIDFGEDHARIGMFGTVSHSINDESKRLLKNSSSKFLALLTDKRDHKHHNDMFSNDPLPKSIEGEIVNLRDEFLKTNRNKTIANPILYKFESTDSGLVLSGKFAQLDADVGSDPEKVVMAGEVDTICKSKRFFILMRRGEKNIRVQFDFSTQFLGICKAYVNGSRYMFHLLLEQDALGKRAYYTLEGIGAQADGNLPLDF